MNRNEQVQSVASARTALIAAHTSLVAAGETELADQVLALVEPVRDRGSVLRSLAIAESLERTSEFYASFGRPLRAEP